MKKIISMLLLLGVAGIFTACGSSEGDATSLSGSKGKAAAGQPAKTAALKGGTASNAAAGKNLVVYFSHSGNTQAIANLIHENVGGDIVQIETASPYPQDYDQCTARAKEEQQNNARPKLANHINNMDAYDTVFIGYPDWWSTMPMAVFTFLEEYDFSGKRIVPFCTHGGSGFGRSIEDIRNICRNATMVQGLAVHGSSAKTEASEREVVQWLRSINTVK